MKSPRFFFALGLASLLCVFSSCLAQRTHAALASSVSASASPTGPEIGPSTPLEPTALRPETLTIPGPLRSFLRMAGLSQEAHPDQVLALLAYNVYTLGSQSGRETEYLRLLSRYVQQARELQALAGPDKVIRISGCSQAQPLMEILGYRLFGGCGQKSATLMTFNPERAFLTSDSGFPLTALEQALESNSAFSYPYSPTAVPVLLKTQDWTAISSSGRGRGGNLLDVLLRDLPVARLYWAFSRLDTETRQDLSRSPGLKKLLPNAAVLDFYGTEITIRNGRVMAPGGDAAEQGWRQLVGASTRSPGEFVLHLVERDRGWLAAYYDVLARINAQQQARLTRPDRLRRLFEDFYAADRNAYAAAASFRKAPLLLVLFTRLQWDANGEPYVPGNLVTWRKIMEKHSDSAIVRQWSRRGREMSSPEQLLGALVAFSRAVLPGTPLPVYLTLSEIDRQRAQQNRLSPETVLLLASHYAELGSWEPLFSEFSDLNDASIALFVKTADRLNRISDHALRANAVGILQANLGLWQILARQGQIPEDRLNGSWQSVLSPFAQISTSAQLFDAGEEALSKVSVAAGAQANPTEDDLVNLLAGPRQQSVKGQQIHAEMANRIRSVMAGQRLVSLDTIVPLGAGLRRMAQGAAPSADLMPLAEELRQFQMPQPIFTRSEKSQWAPGVYENHHVDVQTRLDLTKILRNPPPPAKLDVSRGELTLYLRDTLVGLNYAYYEPPGAQLLHNNPLFVRSHDFTGDTISGLTEEPNWQPAQVADAGTPAGGGAYLLGSLSNLPYALAISEEDFLAPDHVQALIWNEVAPELLVSSTLPRWWNVTPHELHAIALYQESGEELLRASTSQPELLTKVAAILSESMPPREVDNAIAGLRAGHADEVIARITPADTFYLAARFRKEYPEEAGQSGPKGRELETLIKQYPAEVNLARLSRDFGVPHPALTRSATRELLDLQPFPAFEGSASRLFGESWDSNNLYWARLADEKGESPVVLNRLAPMLTRAMVTNIFASNFEDWQAVLRALRQTGQEFMDGKISLPSAPTNTTSLR